MQLVVNDLSTNFSGDRDIRKAKEIMEKFIQTYYSVKKLLQNDSVLLDKHYSVIELAPNYRLTQWLNDNQVDIELKRKFRRILNQSRTFDSEEFEQEYKWKLDAEFHCGEMVSKSCQLAYEIEGLLISFLSDACWKASLIQGVYIFLDAASEIVSEKANVQNVSCEENVTEFCEKYKTEQDKKSRDSIRSGQDILLCKESAFPNLVFCDNALKQLQMEIGGVEAKQVYRRLRELQTVAKEMKGKFDLEKLTHATPETEATLQRFEEEHRIMLPNGKRQIFSWHIRFTGGYAGRIFFEPVAQENVIYIGHIGKKLPTAKYH